MKITFKNANNFANYIVNECQDTRKLPYDLRDKMLHTNYRSYKTFSCGKNGYWLENHKNEYNDLKNKVIKEIQTILENSYSFPIEYTYKVAKNQWDSHSLFFDITIEENVPIQMELSDFI